MALRLKVDEADLAKILTSLVESAERARAVDDPTAERLYLRLADQIEDSVPEAYSERLGLACEKWREAEAERRRPKVLR